MSTPEPEIEEVISYKFNGGIFETLQKAKSAEAQYRLHEFIDIHYHYSMDMEELYRLLLDYRTSITQILLDIDA